MHLNRRLSKYLQNFLVHIACFFCSFLEFFRRLKTNKLWFTAQNGPSYDAQVPQSPTVLKKQATICFEVLLPRTSFARFGSTSKTHTVILLFCFGLIRIHPATKKSRTLQFYELVLSLVRESSKFKVLRYFRKLVFASA